MERLEEWGELKKGDQCRVSGERGEFTFHALVTPDHGPTYVEVYGGLYKRECFRFFDPEKKTITPIKKKKIVKIDENGKVIKSAKEELSGALEEANEVAPKGKKGTGKVKAARPTRPSKPKSQIVIRPASELPIIEDENYYPIPCGVCIEPIPRTGKRGRPPRVCAGCKEKIEQEQIELQAALQVELEEMTEVDSPSTSPSPDPSPLPSIPPSSIMVKDEQDKEWDENSNGSIRVLFDWDESDGSDEYEER